MFNHAKAYGASGSTLKKMVEKHAKERADYTEADVLAIMMEADFALIVGFLASYKPATLIGIIDQMESKEYPWKADKEDK
jgi:hypothetical protein